jgi:F0F1-type ATP synthase gamma subunit
MAVSSDRGLCGGVHSGIVKSIRNYIKELGPVRLDLMVACYRMPIHGYFIFK